MIYFCTYFDKNYLSKFLSLKSSLESFNFKFTIYALCLDNYSFDFFKKHSFANVKTISLDEIENEYDNLIKVKKKREVIEYYFTLTPFLPKFIFKKYSIRQISYLDSDFYFYQSPKKIIYSNLDSSVVLIQQNVSDKYGKYNVGWLYFNFDYEETINILNEWSNQCLEKCSDIPHKGSYADQKYLDEWTLKLKYSRVYQPEYTCLSPWDSNIFLDQNLKTMIAFHFHAIEIFDEHFSTGFHKYNKKSSQKIIKRIYLPYINRLLLIEKKYNLKSSSIRNKRKNIFKKYLVKLRNFKSYIKKIYYKDKHIYRV